MIEIFDISQYLMQRFCMRNKSTGMMQVLWWDALRSYVFLDLHRAAHLAVELARQAAKLKCNHF
jgi:hypothetical protein